MTDRGENLTEGERWTREQLELLLADGLRPAPFIRFLAASQRRAATIRDERPELAFRARAWMGVGAGAWIVLATVGIEPFRRRLTSGLGWWAATTAMLEWHLGMFETADGRPRQLGSADALTLSRAWLVPVVADSPSLPVIAAGAATDVLDGILARGGEPTRAGRDLEGLVDTCFTLAALRGLARQGRVGPAAALAESGRLLGGAGFATAHYFGRSRAPERRIISSARSASILRFGGVLAAAAGRRRLGEALIVAGVGVSTALTAAASREGRSQPST